MSDLPGLVVDIEARIDKLEKGLKRANVAQNRASGQMERRAVDFHSEVTRVFHRELTHL